MIQINELHCEACRAPLDITAIDAEYEDEATAVAAFWMFVADHRKTVHPDKWAVKVRVPRSGYDAYVISRRGVMRPPELSRLWWFDQLLEALDVKPYKSPRWLWQIEERREDAEAEAKAGGGGWKPKGTPHPTDRVPA